MNLPFQNKIAAKSYSAQLTRHEIFIWMWRESDTCGIWDNELKWLPCMAINVM